MLCSYSAKEEKVQQCVYVVIGNAVGLMLGPKLFSVLSIPICLGGNAVIKDFE